jgi:hypothetical protein
VLLAVAGWVLGGCAAADSIAVGGYDPDAEDLGADGSLDRSPSTTGAGVVSPRADSFDFLLGTAEDARTFDRFPGGQALGGYLDGTWIVEDTLNPERESRVLLQRWGEQAMDLRTESCLGAVKKLTVFWEGELTFDPGFAMDERTETRVADILIDGECLGDALGVGRAVKTSATNCATLEALDVDSEGRRTLDVNCTSDGDYCACRGRRVSEGDSSGPRSVLGSKVRIGDTFYDYSVIDERLYFRQQSSNRIVVMRLSTAPPLPPVIERDPVPR